VSAALSRRYGRASYYPPLLDLSWDVQGTLTRLTVEPGTEFEDLPEPYRQLILEAEANRQRALAERAAAPAPASPQPDRLRRPACRARSAAPVAAGSGAT
jgi:hypothetical protein